MLNGDDLLERLKSCLGHIGLRYLPAKSHIIWKMPLTDCRIEELFASARSCNAGLLLYANMKLHVEPSARALAAEYLARVNYGLILGNFELDMNDGEVRFKTLYPVCGEVDDLFLIKCVYNLELMFQRYGDGLLSVIFGYDTPEHAVYAIENSEREEDSAEDGEGGEDERTGEDDEE